MEKHENTSRKEIKTGSELASGIVLNNQDRKSSEKNDRRWNIKRTIGTMETLEAWMTRKDPFAFEFDSFVISIWLNDKKMNEITTVKY